MINFRKIIFFIFGFAFFFIPLVLWPYTSEVFEFNKTVLLYASTVLVSAFWLLRIVSEKRFIFVKTKLDTPLVIFVLSQFISTLISIDPSTSWFGYYSRFNGGLLTTLCYSVLYWAFVTNITKEESFSLLKTTFVSAFLVSIYGVLEHFGIDSELWVQDVKSRVFSTLGQPNWLASWLVALIPVSLALGLKENIKKHTFWIYLSFSLLLFWVLIFTKSRSGFLGFGISALIFAILVIWKKSSEVKHIFKPAVIFGCLVVAICLISGTQWTPNIYSLLNKKITQENKLPVGPALEVGGTESGTIRKIVWTGAMDVWKNYPLFGTGVETFAYSFYKYRPPAQNLVSEWDFVYNKAHNQYLNFAANSGSLGLGAYIYLIVITIVVLYKNDLYNFGLIAGYFSLLITNFFGFSVVPTDLLFFLFPAFALADANPAKKENNSNAFQKILFTSISVAAIYMIFAVYNYWKADLYYSKAKIYNGNKRSDMALENAKKATSLNPNQALYHIELASSYTALARAYNQAGEATAAAQLANFAVSESQMASELSPSNMNIKRTRFGIFVMLSTINSQYIVPAGQVLVDSINSAPTDAKLHYNLALYYIQIGNPNKGEETFKKAIELKANYKEARLAYAIYLIDLKRNAEAKEQLEYILTKIDPKDELAKQTLESIK